MKKTTVICVALAMAAAFTIVGVTLAKHKPLWGDEIYSQSSSIEGNTYGQIIAGKIGEGNGFPLFYLIQKFFCDLTGYHSPGAWKAGHEWDDPRSCMLLRVLPLVCMSSAVVLIFYFFSRFYGIWTGLYSLAVAMSSFMVWAYAFEARPYALWFLLTTMQVLCFLWFLKEGKSARAVGRILVFIHCLLALTVSLSVIQITAMCALLLFLKWNNWQRYIGLWLLPVAIVMFYSMHAPKLTFWFKEGFMGLIGAGIPQDRFFILGLFGLYWIFSWGISRSLWPASSWFKGIDPATLRLTGYYGVLTMLVLAGYLGTLVLLKLTASATNNGCQVPNRYFISLAPLGIIGVTLFSHYLVSFQKNFWRFSILALLFMLLVWRVFRTMALVRSLHMF